LVQGPARRLHDAALDLTLDALGIDGLAAVGCCDRSDQANAAGLVLDFKLDGHRAVAGKVLIPSKSEALPAPIWRLGSGLPTEPLGRKLHYLPRAGLAQVPQAEFDGILASFRSQLVHEAFDCEHIGVGAEAA